MYLCLSIPVSSLIKETGFGEQGRFITGIHRSFPFMISTGMGITSMHSYYLILPAAKPSFPPPHCLPAFPLPLPSRSSSPHGYVLRSSPLPSSPPPPRSPSGNQKLPSELFDFVKQYPMGLPVFLIRSYLGQNADLYLW
ncbi:hypothetical protein BS47DRAFT_903791 [Hydnum rufescens UP504]|uniref:Uncharacterized protein n=1 Tax=Hydnum rufescens UP504 TaxID=1448309 RepID=A0A9P6DXP4_9AGAM|nr:hypothetical protein BS47DRAFT_903791 [Hydnum rufescens UP504]